MSNTYQPGFIPDDPKQLVAALRNEFAALLAAFESAKPSETFEVLYAQPDRVMAGMVVYADGTTWNPGSGAGIYRRSADNTSWVHLG